LGIAALVLAAILIGLGVFAAFTDTNQATIQAQAGSLTITGGDQTFSIDGMAPGDFALRDLTISIPAEGNVGDLIRAIGMTVPAAGVTDTAGPGGASLLTGAQGLQVLLAHCTEAWTVAATGTAAGTAGPNGVSDSATCGDGTGTVTVSQTEIPLNNLVDANDIEFDAADFGLTPTANGTYPSGVDLNLLVQLRLPQEADNTYQEGSLDFDLVFEALQRAAQNV
jgi:predicted ribosomally synthesized peptide with SipW-like signal peptide